ncbi:class II histone deacetylase [Oceaniradius stylonematis]|uniref:class II histone deacetylase n=1 Tax=Oceaniradius stylonematis TaxID=2184161 RepID=UPI00273D2651|nr:class II histone deacetylase [Oceaniradius stylonematis]
MAKSGKKRTGWVAEELYFWHHTQNWAGLFEPGLSVQPGEHFENAETKRRFRNLVEASGFGRHLVPVRAAPADDEALMRVHPKSHIEHIEKVAASGGGDASELTPMGRSTADIARLAAGGVIAAVDAIVDGTVDNAYVLCRPPGHHAEPETAMGFCFYANAAIGVRHAQKRGLERIVTVDWDVHHGNGTETIFYDDADVLTISLHQDNLFPPGRGGIGDTGSGAGLGANLNIPLPPGSGGGAYRHAIDELVAPAIEAFKPDMIVLPCGFDASALDPLGTMMLSSSDFGWMAGRMAALADDLCGGRILATHEGGYSAVHVPFCGLAVLEALSGASSGVTDPYDAHITGYGGQDLQPHQAEAVAAARKAYAGGH